MSHRGMRSCSVGNLFSMTLIMSHSVDFLVLTNLMMSFGLAELSI